MFLSDSRSLTLDSKSALQIHRQLKQSHITQFQAVSKLSHHCKAKSANHHQDQPTKPSTEAITSLKGTVCKWCHLVVQRGGFIRTSSSDGELANVWRQQYPWSKCMKTTVVHWEAWKREAEWIRAAIYNVATRWHKFTCCTFKTWTWWKLSMGQSFQTGPASGRLLWMVFTCYVASYCYGDNRNWQPGFGHHSALI